MTEAELRKAGRELAERSCAAQGIPAKLTRAELDRLAPLFRVMKGRYDHG